MAAETKKAYHIEHGDRPVCRRERFPGRILDKIASILMPPLTLDQGSAREDGGRHCRRPKRLTRPRRRRRRRSRHAGERQTHSARGQSEVWWCQAASERGWGGGGRPSTTATTGAPWCLLYQLNRGGGRPLNSIQLIRDAIPR